MAASLPKTKGLRKKMRSPFVFRHTVVSRSAAWLTRWHSNNAMYTVSARRHEVLQRFEQCITLYRFAYIPVHTDLHAPFDIFEKYVGSHGNKRCGSGWNKNSVQPVASYTMRPYTFRIRPCFSGDVFFVSCTCYSCNFKAKFSDITHAEFRRFYTF